MEAEQQAERIHRASLALLEEPGVRIEHDALCARLLKAGARPGAAAQVLRFPEELVMDCVRLAPARVLLADRAEGGYTIGKGCASRVWSVPGLNLWRQGTFRPFTAQDMADTARLLSQLPAVDGVFGLSMSDVPVRLRDVTGLRIMAEHTRKHVRVLCFTPEGAEALCEMRAVVSDAPWFSIGFTAHGPLRWTRLALEIFSRTAGHGIPTTINGEPMAGVSGPVTLAGSAAVGNAEILAGLVVNQVLEPGRPCIYNLGLAHVFDMRTAIAVTGAPENHLLAGISAAMGRFYELPSCSWVSTEAMCPDGQAALEKAIGFYTHLQAGVDLIWGVGQLESEMTFAPAQAVIDNELIAYSRRIRRGVTVNRESLALEAVREVGVGGSFLDHDHTLANFRQELFEPSLLFRSKRDAWSAQGGPRLDERAEARADELIARDGAPALTDEQNQAFLRIEQRLAAMNQ